MENIDTLSRHGLFDAKVPRYTSYPPANHFQNDVGQRSQLNYLSCVEEGAVISVYIHIPFCKRLCWFCACRTQGSKTNRPVEAYVEVVRKELRAVRAKMADGVKMGRLHLGGGTPTILSCVAMEALLGEVFEAFPKADGFEFSVEIDPTEAAPELLRCLIGFGMNRASIGVQDFAPAVQRAIGRPQTVAQTQEVIEVLRAGGVEAINLDLLYGLPHQTPESFCATLDQILAMEPSRLAIYGYAHVPWMSKRQVMIKAEDLPGARARFDLAAIANGAMRAAGYFPIGIDHFAKPSDSLFAAQKAGRLRRNFQGYTDDQSETLIGFGASAISRFAQGYVQNAVATSAYQERIAAGGFAGHKGYEMTGPDVLVAAMIEALMCQFRFPVQELIARFAQQAQVIEDAAAALMARYGDVFEQRAFGLEMREGTFPLARVIASDLDAFTSANRAHAAAI
ncbi:MAG: oxygen-independent coproporphyrinogen III oxidase [Sulfitobacter sp.]